MRRDEAVLADMLEFAQEILTFTAGLDEAAFAANHMVRAAVLHHLMLLGEAVRRVSHSLKAAHPEVPWSRISNQRNILIHDYDEVRLPKVWRVVATEVPSLVTVLEPIVRQLSPPAQTS